jgi:hypothetical protein
MGMDRSAHEYRLFSGGEQLSERVAYNSSKRSIPGASRSLSMRLTSS